MLQTQAVVLALADPGQKFCHFQYGLGHNTLHPQGQQQGKAQGQQDNQTDQGNIFAGVDRHMGTVIAQIQGANTIALPAYRLNLTEIIGIPTCAFGAGLRRNQAQGVTIELAPGNHALGWFVVHHDASHSGLLARYIQ